MKQLEIRIVSLHDSKEHIKRLYDIMIYGYEVTEVEVWGENYKRMLPEEFDAIIEKGELIGAWWEGVPVGSIHTSPLTKEAYVFGLLSADFDYKGKNIGRQLIQAAEEHARKNGAAFMELEILRLKDKELPVKEQLRDWYTRLGYEHTITIDFADRKPDKAEKAEHFAAPSVFDCYRKSL